MKINKEYHHNVWAKQREALLLLKVLKHDQSLPSLVCTYAAKCDSNEEGITLIFPISTIDTKIWLVISEFSRYKLFLTHNLCKVTPEAWRSLSSENAYWGLDGGLWAKNAEFAALIICITRHLWIGRYTELRLLVKDVTVASVSCSCSG